MSINTQLIHEPMYKESHEATVSKRGLASASEETRERVAKSGGAAPHEVRGLQGSTPELRKAVARKGGLARGAQRRRIKQETENRVFST
jgi:hypothetical protein